MSCEVSFLGKPQCRAVGGKGDQMTKLFENFKFIYHNMVSTQKCILKLFKTTKGEGVSRLFIADLQI